MPSTAFPQEHSVAGTELVRMWEADDPLATVVLVHGIAEHSGRYERTGDLLAAAGFTVRAFDLIGFGGTGGRRGHIDDFSQYLDQLEAHVAWSRRERKPVVLLGFSMGALIAAQYLISDRQPPDFAVLSAPSLRSGARWQRAVAPVLARIAPTFPIPQALRGEQLSRDPAVAEAYFSDPLVYTKSTPRFGFGFFSAMKEVLSGLGRLSVPTLVIQGLDDTIVPPQTTAVFGELPGVERRTYPGLRHELCNEPEGPEVVGEVIAWLKGRI